jgi:hypothetical protein
MKAPKGISGNADNHVLTLYLDDGGVWYVVPKGGMAVM